MKQERAKRARSAVTAVLAVLVLGALAASPGARRRAGLTARQIASGAQDAFAGRQEATQKLTLPEMRVYALQLGVYDSGELAQQEQQRLSQQGMPCIIWQRERMRIVCAAALSEQALASAQAAGLETYVIEDEMPEVQLRLSAAQRELEGATELLTLPDSAFGALLLSQDARPLSDVIDSARKIAQRALSSHGENALYTQLAQSIVNWCTLIERAQEEWGDTLARQYAALTMCTLCRELRAELIAQASA